MVNNNNILGTSLKYGLVINDAKQYQVDSLIVADTLPALNYWFTNSFRDYKTNEVFVKRTYIKEYKANRSSGIIGRKRKNFCLRRLGTTFGEAYHIYWKRYSFCNWRGIWLLKKCLQQGK